MGNWQSLPFEECIEPVVYTAKVQRKYFLSDGAYPIVSQEDAFINGFWNEEADIFRVDHPLIVFGDHTRALKYIDFDFVLGADGVKVLKPKPFLHPHFFYYQLHTAKLASLGYARHYRPRWPPQNPPLMVTQTPPGRTVEIVMQSVAAGRFFDPAVLLDCEPVTA